MKKQINANHMADAVNGNVEIQLQEIAKVGLYFRDVTFDQSGYPTNVGEYRALVGFLDQRDAQLFAALTNGEFAMFYKKDGWQFLSYRGPAELTDIYNLAGSCHVVYLEGNESYDNLCEKIQGLSLRNYLIDVKDVKDVLDIDDFVKEIVKFYIQEYHLDSGKVYDFLKLKSEKEEEFEYLKDIAEEIYDCLSFLDNFKGCNGYIVIDDVNWSIEGEYDYEYPCYYSKDNNLYIFGVLYPQDREEEIRELIKD